MDYLQSNSQDKFVVGNNINAFSTTPTARSSYENVPGGTQRQPVSTQVIFNDNDLTSLLKNTESRKIEAFESIWNKIFDN